MEISKHARMRLKQRAGIKRNSVDRLAARAFERGISHEQCTGKLKKYIDKTWMKNKRATNIRIYGMMVYIFSIEETLITVLHLPNDLKGLVTKLRKRLCGVNRNQNQK